MVGAGRFERRPPAPKPSERLFFKFYKPDEADASEILELQFDASVTIQLEGRRTEDQTGAFRLKFRRKFD